MGYFANGTEGRFYEDQYCARCIHGNWLQDAAGNATICAVWSSHLLHNHEECNKKDSILHELIPRNGLWNAQCKMFLPVVDAKPASNPDQGELWTA